MGHFILKRMLQLVLLLIGVSFIVFFSMHLAPGDPARIMAGPAATKSDIAALHRSLGLDKPIVVQYLDWIGKVLHGNLGTSYQTSQPVTQAILSRLPTTIKLATASMVLALIIGIPLGIVAAIKHNTWIDFTSTTLSLLGVSIPNFWLGTMLILIFAVMLHALPIGGMAMHWYTVAGLKELILPAIALSAGSAALIARTTRATMLEVLQQDYVRTAKAAGLRPWKIILTHEFRNALIPIITVIGINFGTLLGGTIVTEQVFTINGVGRLMINAISARDFPVVQGTVLFIATIFVLVNLVVDIIYAKVDPRISY